MDMATVLSAVQTLISTMSELKEALSWLSIFSYESDMDDLLRTVEFLTSVLEDAEAKQQLLKQDQVFVKHIKDAVFDADDLMDELLTFAQQQRIMEADGNLSLREKLSHFFSKSNPICVSYWMSRGIKDLKKKLDAIAYNNQFTLKIDPQPIKERSRETCSYVEEAEIIGREHDLEKIVGTLLASSDDQTSNNNVSVLSIVGMGGLGKTALAQLVYNDSKVREAFPLRMWTCVSDDGQDELNVKDILGNILGRRNQDGFTLEQVQEQLRAELEGKKFLLVLDDLWTEDAHQWGKLVKYPNGNKRGSWILVTTRSKNTAAAITDGQIHELSGLSNENSWSLFEKSAFNSQQSHPLDEDLVSIGKQIVDGCGGVPLAIKVAGSLLYGQAKSEWLSVQKIGLANTEKGERNIMRILKLSYYHLESPLRSCFSYCALFPKDFRMGKDILIRLWMAQGYIIPLTGQSTEEAGEEYFSTLLRRCFFQDIKKNKDGEIESCKIHDLMLDIAQNVSGKEICASNTVVGKVDKDVRHLSILNWSQFGKCFSLDNTHLRSLISVNLRAVESHYELSLDALIKSFKRLRVLDLSEKNIKCLPDSIGDLFHLRYLDLSRNGKMEALPNSITKLCNLQTLRLCNCGDLKELPKDFSRLVKLRVLDIKDCWQLSCMPRGMGKLTSLHTLEGTYKVGERKLGEHGLFGNGTYKSWKQWLDDLEDLKSLINLKGTLIIDIMWPDNEDAKNEEDQLIWGGLYLRGLEHVDYLKLSFPFSARKEDEVMRVMEALQPHSNLKRLHVEFYNGTEMPGWGLLPHLVELELLYCFELKYLPWLGNLCHLKSLVLRNLSKLEYLPWLGNLCHLKYLCLDGLSKLEYIKIEDSSWELASTSSSAQKLSFCPSLQVLELSGLLQFRGWRRGIELEESSSNNNNNNSMIIPQETMQLCLPQLKYLKINNCKKLTSCSLLCPMLETLHLQRFNLGLQIVCTKRNNPEGRTHHHVPNLSDLTVSEGAWLYSIPVESFRRLQTLRIFGDPKMAFLPINLQYLSALRTLEIERCKNLKAIPYWIPKLTSLKKLSIINCSENLKGRCQSPAGKDWHLIRHIHRIKLD